MIALIGIGAIALGFTIFLCLAELEHRKRIRHNILRREVVLGDEHPRRNGLPHREKDWRNSAPRWSDPTYFGGTRRRP